MAHYLVTAKPKPDLMQGLLENLREDAYVSMRPFGKGLTYSLRNARLREDGYATWEEEDYCSPPLSQGSTVQVRSRTMVLDRQNGIPVTPECLSRTDSPFVHP